MNKERTICVIDCDELDNSETKSNIENKQTEYKPKLNETNSSRKKFGVISRNFFNKTRDKNTERTLEFMKKKKLELDKLQFGSKD
ncbi:hypothetical protein ENUP19_0305G0084 [Entamoeba nuttalli]|uniref:Uncharacterized protein n=1 Tax=Entamoeba nuttalli TaxID=412467 RepID=A0ABQ0DVG0_9EUKA